MKKIKPFLLFISIAFIAFQCREDDGPQQATDPYEGCCGIEPVEFTVGNAKLYVPNAFTVNADGINDVFFPFFNNKISKIENFSISTPDLSVLYIAPIIDLQNPLSTGWNGEDPDGKMYAGLFNYAMTVTDDAGVLQTISGSACSILCDTFATAFKTKTGCFFPVQENGDGGVDASLPTLEDECFGQ